MTANRGRLLLGESVESIQGDGTAVTSVRTAGGKSISVDLVVVGVGVVPAASLAEAAGLMVDNGIRVDAMPATSDPDVFAIGDCASNPVAATGDRALCGRGTAYDAVPRFWSVHGGIRLQIAGLADLQISSALEWVGDGRRTK
jgi:3-phenylpropionate/trans-cinnamate dioxygenase ferredoxin reductase subunit